MKGLYVISLMIAFLSVFPIAVLVIRADRKHCKQLHIICADDIKCLSELEQRIREVWWEAHFFGDDTSDKVVVLTDGDKDIKALCHRLKKEFPELSVKKYSKLIKILRNEEYVRKKVYRA